MNLNKYINRLLEEWKRYGKIIIAVDYDDTLFPWGFKSEEDNKQIDEIFDLLKACKQTGAYITIWSACDKDRFIEIEEYCKSKGLEIDSINQNPIELPYGKDRKIYANIFLDDRAGLQESMTVLNTVLYHYRSYLQTLKTTTDVA